MKKQHKEHEYKFETTDTGVKVLEPVFDRKTGEQVFEPLEGFALTNPQHLDALEADLKIQLTREQESVRITKDRLAQIKLMRADVIKNMPKAEEKDETGK